MAGLPVPLVPRLPDDSPLFLEEADRLIAESLESHWVRNACVVRISGWFGPRWLGFSGKVLGALGVSKIGLVVPPFVPGRVLAECWLSMKDAVFVQVPPPFALHRRQPSSANLRRQLAPDTAYFWVSSGSETAGRSALMLYRPAEDGQHLGTYLGFSTVSRLKLVARNSFPNRSAPLPLQRGAPAGRSRRMPR